MKLSDHGVQPRTSRRKLQSLRQRSEPGAGKEVLGSKLRLPIISAMLICIWGTLMLVQPQHDKHTAQGMETAAATLLALCLFPLHVSAGHVVAVAFPGDALAPAPSDG